MRAALLLVVVVVVAALAGAARAEEGDVAPFALLVEGAGGARRAGTLVSRRGALTCGACARGPGLVVRAAAGEGSAVRVRRVLRDGGAALAVLDLEQELGGEARPIVMAAGGGAAGARAGAACHVVRARQALVILDVTLSPRSACRAPPAALCLNGLELCEVDGGAGLVCEGWLCGVVAGVEGADGPEGEGRCASSHTVLDLLQYRQFLHCAHTLGDCTRGACAGACSELALLPGGDPPPPPPSPAAAIAPERSSASPATPTLTAPSTRGGPAGGLQWVEARDYPDYGDERPDNLTLTQPPTVAAAPAERTVPVERTAPAERTAQPERAAPAEVAARAGPPAEPEYWSAYSAAPRARPAASAAALLLLLCNTT